MGLSQTEIASIVDSDVRTGLRGVGNFSYAFEMLEREVPVSRNRIISKDFRTPGNRLEECMQTLNGITVDTAQLSKWSGGKDRPRFHFVVPNLVLEIGPDYCIDYLGAPDRMSPSWKVYINEGYQKHRYRPATAKLPFVYIDPTPRPDGYLDAFLFNFVGNIQAVSMTAILENPEDASYFPPFANYEHFPAPASMIEEIIRRLSAKYMAAYRQAHAPNQSNKQTDQVS